MSPATRTDVSHYTYRVTWSPEDREYVGTCAEFPSLSWLESDQIQALAGIRRVVSDVVADMTASGEAVPEPIAERGFSGKFNVRISTDLHRRLVLEAAEQGVSLNRFVEEHLAGSV